jgi:tripartite-type tricarboxylate transporter receptor subunit TctC
MATAGFTRCTRIPSIALAASTALVLTACGGVETSTGDDDGGDWPSGTVEMYVGADPGGSSDLISRAVSQGLSEELGESFPVLNKSGSNGALAAAEVMGAEPDGSTIAIQNASLFAITPLAVSEDEVTNIDDFEVVYGVSRDDYVMVTNPDSGYASVDDLGGASDKVTYGTTGVGTGSQLSCALLFADLGTEAEAVPFDGGAPALTALLGGQVDTACLQVGEAIENIESGKLVPLSVFGSERVEYLPDVPTAQEQGLDVEVAQYRFMTVPKGTPDDVKETLVEGMQAAFETEAYQKFNEQNSLTPMEIPGDDVVAQLEEDKQRYADLVEEHGINLAE